MDKKEKADWYFTILTNMVFISALAVTAYDFVELQRMTYNFEAVNILGYSLVLIGFTLLINARRTLGKSFAFDLSSSHKRELIKNGIYKHIRHPIYLAIILLCGGIPLLFSSLYGFVIMLCFIPCLLYRIGIEESMLIEEFGDEYREYMKKTKKLFPLVY
jgi:protein-S-isoprenylcysteine O-methyltransferase Ste14